MLFVYDILFSTKRCSSKGRITSDVKIIFRPSRINPRKLLTICYAMIRATTTTHETDIFTEKG